MHWKDSIRDFVAYKSLHPQKIRLSKPTNQLSGKKQKVNINKLIKDIQKQRTLLNNANLIHTTIDVNYKGLVNSLETVQSAIYNMQHQLQIFKVNEIQQVQAIGQRNQLTKKITKQILSTTDSTNIVKQALKSKILQEQKRKQGLTSKVQYLSKKIQKNKSLVNNVQVKKSVIQNLKQQKSSKEQLQIQNSLSNNKKKQRIHREQQQSRNKIQQLAQYMIQRINRTVIELQKIIQQQQKTVKLEKLKKKIRKDEEISKQLEDYLDKQFTINSIINNLNYQQQLEAYKILNRQISFQIEQIKRDRQPVVEEQISLKQQLSTMEEKLKQLTLQISVVTIAEGIFMKSSSQKSISNRNTSGQG